MSRLQAAVRARDLDALTTLFADGLEVVHHPTGATIRREEGLHRFRLLFQTEDLALSYEHLASLGDSLLLGRDVTSFARFVDNQLDFGQSRSSYVNLFEVDDRGLALRVEVFAEDRLGDAVARLYERYATLLRDDPERTRAAATARSVAAVLGPFDLERYAEGIAPDVEFVDHRIVGFPSGRGVRELLRSLGTLPETADDVTTRIDDVLALRADAFLVRWTTAGTDRISRGAFVWQFLRLCTFGADGLLRRAEQFDVDRADEAFARFDALARGTPGLTAETPAAKFANAACRAVERFETCWQARDWDGVVATFAPTHAMDDRRALLRLRLEGAAYFASLRMVYDMPSSHWSFVLLATRGERLALFQVEIVGEAAGSGPLMRELLWLVEVDADGRRIALVAFDLDAHDAAYVELDDRYAAGEGAPYAELLANLRAGGRAAAAGDRDTLARLLPADFTVVDHRRFGGTGWRLARHEYLATMGFADGLGLCGDARVDHVLRLSVKAGVVVAAWYGTLEGGDFESSMVVVYTHEGNRPHSWEFFDLDQLDAALARYGELSAAPRTAARIENAAVRAAERLRDVWAARDWERFAALFPPGFRNIDRRKVVQLDLDRVQFLEAFHLVWDAGSARLAFQVIATRGSQLAMVRVSWELAEHNIGPTEVEFVAVIEVDDDGNPAALVMFDPDDLDGAYAELEKRYAAGAADSRRAALTRAFSQAFAARDWDTLATLLAPDLVVNDHRLLGWETLHGPAAYIQALKQLVDLAPDVQLRVDHLTMSDPRVLYVTTWVGTREGGPFESPSVIECELDEMGRIHRFDQYDIDRLDEIRARLEGADASDNPAP